MLHGAVNGWPDGYAFVLSFLAPVWTIGASIAFSSPKRRFFSLVSFYAGAYDSSVHISEEAANARTAVPFAIISSAAIAGIVGWGQYSMTSC